MTSKVTRQRIDWRAERERIDLAAVATGLLGPAPGRLGERGRRLWWRCPFHEDNNPSFMVEPGKAWWKCWGCGASGDAATLVMKLKGLSFPEALADLMGGPKPSIPAYSSPTLCQPRNRELSRVPRGLPLADALALVGDAEGRLWTSEGSTALAYLSGPRGLSLETIQAARLGWTPRAVGVPWTPPGIVIPWRKFDTLSMVKFRPPDAWRESFPAIRQPPKYLEGFRDGPLIYPDRRVIRPGHPLVIVEGELDCLLLGQELEGLAGVVTLGGTGSTRPEPEILGLMLPASPWFIATDNDDAGDKAAARWEGTRATRARLPSAYKDWTEMRQAGVNLRRWWTDLLGGDPSPKLFTWDELSRWRWGPAVGEASLEPV